MKRWLILSIGLVVLSVGTAALVWVNRDDWLPESVPVHWGPSGKADGFVPRARILPYLLLMPGVVALIVGLGLVLPWLSPVRFKIEPFRPTYEYIMGLIAVMFTYIHLVTLAAYMLLITDVTRWLLGGILLGIAALGNVLGKVQRNFWIGIRTPWTLASDTVWIRTHRLAAWCFVLGGVVGFALVMVGVNGLIAMSVFGIAALVPVVYSLVLYKRLEREGRLGGDAVVEGREDASVTR